MGINGEPEIICRLRALEVFFGYCVIKLHAGAYTLTQAQIDSLRENIERICFLRKLLL